MAGQPNNTTSESSSRVSWRTICELLGCFVVIGTVLGATWSLSATQERRDSEQRERFNEFERSLNHKLNEKFNAIEHRFVGLEAKISEVESKAVADRFTLTMASEQALRNAINNPGMPFADPRDPTKTIIVDVPFKRGGE